MSIVKEPCTLHILNLHLNVYAFNLRYLSHNYFKCLFFDKRIDTKIQMNLYYLRYFSFFFFFLNLLKCDEKN